jgi:hypothetical protein
MRQREERVDAGAAEQLHRWLDRQPPPDIFVNRTGDVRQLALSAMTLQHLDERDSEPDPAASFVHRLEERIMRSSLAAQPHPGGTIPTLPDPRHLGGSPAARLRSKGPAAWQRSLRLAAVPVAATIVLGLVTALLFAGGRPPSSDDTFSAAFRSGTPSVSYDVPGAVDIADCDAEARSPGSVAALLGTPTTGDNALPLPMSGDVQYFFGVSQEQAREMLDVLPLASDAEASTVAETLKQLTACRFSLINPYSFPEDWESVDPYEDYDGTYYGLFTDDYFRRGLVQGVGNAELPVLVTTLLPIGPVPPESIEVRQIWTGRLIALVQEPYAEGWYQQLVVFSSVNDRWLVDEVAQVTLRGDTEPAATPESPVPSDHSPQYLEVTLDDDGGRTWDAPSTGSIFRAGVDVTVTVANIGTMSHRYEIPDLDVVIDVRSGHSMSFVLNAPPGEYAYQSFTSPAGADQIQHLNGTFEFVAPGTPIPKG